MRMHILFFSLYFYSSFIHAMKEDIHATKKENTSNSSAASVLLPVIALVYTEKKFLDTQWQTQNSIQQQAINQQATIARSLISSLQTSGDLQLIATHTNADIITRFLYDNNFSIKENRIPQLNKSSFLIGTLFTPYHPFYHSGTQATISYNSKEYAAVKVPHTSFSVFDTAPKIVQLKKRKNTPQFEVYIIANLQSADNAVADYAELASLIDKSDDITAIYDSLILPKVDSIHEVDTSPFIGIKNNLRKKHDTSPTQLMKLARMYLYTAIKIDEHGLSTKTQTYSPLNNNQCGEKKQLIINQPFSVVITANKTILLNAYMGRDTWKEVIVK